MLIHCPECHFDRHINEDQIPPTSTSATCPQCKHRFRFRELPSQASATPQSTESTNAVPIPVVPEIPPQADANPEANAPPQAPTKPPMTPSLPTAMPDDDPLPPGAQIFTKSPKHKDGAQEGNRSLGDLENQNTKPHSSDPQKLTLEDLWQTILEIFQKPDKQKETKYTDEQTNTDKDGAMYDAPVVPWESPEHYNLVNGLVQTVLHVMFSPAAFFGQLRYASAPLTRPIIFFILLGIFQTFAERLWYMISVDLISPNVTDPQMQNFLNTVSDSISLPMSLLVAPLSLSVQLFAFTGITYLMIRLVQPERAYFPIILRIICYSAAPTVICIVPFLGPMISSLWFAVACFIGCKHALDLTWQRTSMALGPLYLVAIAVGLQMARQLVAM